MVDVSALGNLKQFKMEQWRGLHDVRRPPSHQMEEPAHREEL